MTQRRRSPVAVKIIACLLMLASLACLLLPWMKLAADTESGKRLYPEDLLGIAGLDRDAALELVRLELEGEQTPLPRETVLDLVSAVLDGRFPLHRLAKLSGELGEVSAAVGRDSTGRLLSTGRIAIWAVLGLLALLGLIALVCQLTDHRWGILPYFLLGALVAAAVVLLRSELNRALEEEALPMLNQAGMGFLLTYYGIDIHIVKMGIAAYLCPFLALIALLLMGIKKRRAAPARETATPYPARRAPAAPRPAAAPTGWNCPNCGSVRRLEESFCTLCGAERPRLPALVFCPGCGSQLPANTTFCPDCGTRIPARTAAQEADFRLPDEGEL